MKISIVWSMSGRLTDKGFEVFDEGITDESLYAREMGVD
jgi:hypothetical protein